MNRVDRFVESMLREQQPEPFPATEDEAEELRVAIELRAARAGDHEPSEEFVSTLHQRLAVALARPVGVAEAGPPTWDTTESPEAADDVDRSGVAGRDVRRRRFVRVAGIAAASLAAGVTADRVIAATTKPDPDGQASETLQPTVGAWRTVAASAELGEGAVREFDLGSASGFLERRDGQLRAVSGVCTHQGCRLALDASSRQLNCPCHNAVFALSGAIVRYELPVELTPLSLFQVRESDGAVQVFVPPSTGVTPPPTSR
ncbi:Rieske 2Fe-2S domain-containing protein [Solihabitans fulvus]|uniref:Rieske 2Fe-2S domain-containing protein n=1 Tax=Solihabitans fulvus TaxID=1892852 RepID=A0A5B2WU08_9PSEU|nr:Rieske 2Fe-2S domain-containing protein [Solihabitans fulvus]KAA2255231.1 Rieske 2Fe-2S domain-containing protein [Solihabitans fulvus]